MRIFFDMDGVLADFRAGVERTGAVYAPLGTPDRKADDAMWDAIKKTPHFYRHLPEIPRGVALFRGVQSAGLGPEVLTAVPKPRHGMPDAGPDKIAWNGEHLGPDVRTHVCFRAEKRGFCAGPEDILVDDQAKNILEWEQAGGTGVLFSPGGPLKLPPMLALKLDMARRDGPAQEYGPVPVEPVIG